MVRIRRFLTHPVVQNSLALYGVQLAGFLLPLITLPYTARILGPNSFGLLVFAQAFAVWLGVLLEFGFTFSATRDVARSRLNPQALYNLVAGVLAAKIVLSGISLIAVVISWLLVPLFHTHPTYLFGAWLVALSQGWSPSWYFQGVERLRFPALLDIGARLLGTLAVFWVVKSPSDGAKVLFALGFPSLLASVGLLWLMYREVPFGWPQRSMLWQTLRAGWGMFIYRSLVSLYTSLNAFVLGLFVPSGQVGYYGGAERIQGLAAAPFWPVWRAIYPRTSHMVIHDHNRAKYWLQRLALGFGLLGLLLMFGLWELAPLLVRLLLGTGYEASVELLRVLALILPMAALSGVMGLQWLVPLGLERWLNTITLSAGLLNLCLALILVPRLGPLGMAWSVVMTETVVVLLMFLTLHFSGKAFWQRSA